MRSLRRFALLTVLSFCCSVAGLSCSDIKQIGAGAKFSLDELKTLTEEDFTECLVFIGKDPLGYEEGKYIWDSLIQIYQGVDAIPESELRQLGWVAKSIPVKDIKNLTLGDVDTIAAFGIYHNLSESQLEALAEEVLDDWSSKVPSDYTFYDLMALKHLLCGFNKTSIEMIHPDSYKEAAGVLATLRGCSRSALEALASLAISKEAFGDPSTWSSSQVKSVGCVINGLPKEVINVIPPQGIDSLTPDIMPCLLDGTLRAMTPSQLSHLTPSTVAAMSSQQKSTLNSEQQKAVNEAYEVKTDTLTFNRSVRTKISINNMILVLTLIFIGF